MHIFLSRPTWIPPEFESGVNTFLTQLQNLGLTPRTLGVSDYPSKSPLDEVIDILADCKGAIILGVPQIEIPTCVLKGKPIESPLSLATEWNHLEAGLAYAAGLPVLIIHHHSVTRGIFDRGVLNAFLHSVDLLESNWSMQSHLNGAILKWREKCSQGRANFQYSSESIRATVPSVESSTEVDNSPSDELPASLTRTNGSCSKSFEEITTAIESVPPLQRDLIANGYKGLRVQWEVFFKGGAYWNKGLIRVRLKPHLPSFGSSIICMVPEDKYPELKTLHEDSKIEVTGEIDSADRFDIVLKNVHFKFM